MAVTSCTLSFLLLFLSLEIVKCELFTALIDLEHLIYRERELKSSLKNYIAMEEERLATLKKFSEKVENIHNRIDDKNVELFLGHPVNSYLIIKRFFSEWTKVEELLQKDNSEGTTYNNKLNFYLTSVYSFTSSAVIFQLQILPVGNLDPDLGILLLIERFQRGSTC